MKSFDGYFLCGCPDSKEYQKDKGKSKESQQQFEYFLKFRKQYSRYINYNRYLCKRNKGKRP